MSRRALSRSGKVGVIITIIIVAAFGAYAYSSLTSKPSAAIVTTLPGKATSSAVSSTQPALKEVRLLYSIFPAATLGEWYDLKNGGYLEKYGVITTITSVVGSPVAVRALVAGSADIMETGLDGAITAIAAGAPLKIVASWGVVQPFIIITPNSITSFHDMIGKRIAISGIGALVQSLWTGILEKEGIALDQIKFINIGTSGADRLKALFAGTVDVATVYPEDWAAAKSGPEASKFHVFQFSIADVFPFWNYEAIVTTKAYIKDHPDMVQAVVDGLVQLQRDFNGNETRFVDLSMRSFPTRYTQPELSSVWRFLNSMDFFAVNGGINLGRLKDMISYIYTVLAPKSANNTYIHSPSDTLDITFLKRTLDEFGVFKVGGKTAPWDTPDWYLSTASKAPAGGGATTTPKPPSSGYIQRILIYPA